MHTGARHIVSKTDRSMSRWLALPATSDFCGGCVYTAFRALWCFKGLPFESTRSVPLLFFTIMSTTMPFQDGHAEDLAGLKLASCRPPDSGYVTASGSGLTTGESSPKSPEVATADTINGSPIPFQFSIAGGLLPYDNPVDEATSQRFDDVVQRFEGPLVEYVRRNRKKHSPIAIRLLVLGTSKENAKPWIVVFCDQKQAKRLNRFFAKDYVKQIYQRQFEVHVEGRAPLLRNLIAWTSMTSEANDTLCGTIITFDIGDRPTMKEGENLVHTATLTATLGGLVKVVHPDSTYSLYGMTAGHAAHLRQDSVFSLREESSDDDDEGSSEDGSEEEDNFTTTLHSSRILKRAGNSVAPYAMTSENQGAPAFTSASPKIQLDNWRPLGRVLSTGGDETSKSQDYDWTLIKVDDIRIRPNLLRAPSVNPSRFGDLKVLSRPLKRAEKRSVVMQSGPQGPMPGNLSALPSKLLLGTGSRFVDTYMLTLDRQESKYSSFYSQLFTETLLDICDGDSGSWIVDETTLEVYGHLVASDGLGGAYIIPLRSSLEDMRTTFRADAVEFPSSIDVFSYSTATTRSTSERVSQPFKGGTKKVTKYLID